MATIIDKRKQRESVVKSKQKFINRHRTVIQKNIDNIIENNNIKDVLKKKHKVYIPKKSLNEPSYRYLYGADDVFMKGNRRFKEGDEIQVPKSEKGSGSGEGGNSEDVFDDEFIFTLSKDEFADLFFSHLELPNMIKRGFKETKTIKKRAGYIKEGVPAHLDLKKTFQLSIARRIANNKDTPFLDDLDMRYKLYKNKIIPWSQSVVFCVMDVSGSMDQDMKLLAKKFYILLNLFLENKYSKVDLVFIRHHTSAEICDEYDFFYKRETGGTVISSALDLTLTTIQEKYDPNLWNIYIAQTGDGDNFPADNKICDELIRNKLLPICQYFMYLQVDYRDTSYLDLCEKIDNKKLSAKCAENDKDLYMVFSDFFKKGGTKQ